MAYPLQEYRGNVPSPVRYNSSSNVHASTVSPPVVTDVSPRSELRHVYTPQPEPRDYHGSASSSFMSAVGSMMMSSIPDGPVSTSERGMTTGPVNPLASPQHSSPGLSAPRYGYGAGRTTSEGAFSSPGEDGAGMGVPYGSTRPPTYGEPMYTTYASPRAMAFESGRSPSYDASRSSDVYTASHHTSVHDSVDMALLAAPPTRSKMPPSQGGPVVARRNSISQRNSLAGTNPLVMPGADKIREVRNTAPKAGTPLVFQLDASKLSIMGADGTLKEAVVDAKMGVITHSSPDDAESRHDTDSLGQPSLAYSKKPRQVAYKPYTVADYQDKKVRDADMLATITQPQVRAAGESLAALSAGFAGSLRSGAPVPRRSTLVRSRTGDAAHSRRHSQSPRHSRHSMLRAGTSDPQSRASATGSMPWSPLTPHASGHEPEVTDTYRARGVSMFATIGSDSLDTFAAEPDRRMQPASSGGGPAPTYGAGGDGASSPYYAAPAYERQRQQSPSRSPLHPQAHEFDSGRDTDRSSLFARIPSSPDALHPAEQMRRITPAPPSEGMSHHENARRSVLQRLNNRLGPPR